MATNAELSFSIIYFKQQNTTGLNVGKKKDFFCYQLFLDW